MKQHITQEQFEQLTDKQHMIFVDWAVTQMKKDGDYTRPRRSISDLIQFIDEQFEDHLPPEAPWWRIERDDRHGLWDVYTKHFEIESQPELVDALWEAAKLLMEQISLQRGR